MREGQRQEQHKRTQLDEMIERAAKATAQEVVFRQRQDRANLYRSMERLLRAYPRRIRLAEHPEDYEWFPAGRSN